MNVENASLKLLNRTRYAQNRTKYYTVRNTVLAQTERPFFITGSFKDEIKNRRLLSLKKSFLHRNDSRRGPFQKLNLPHAYFSLLGDPSYYSNSELVQSCQTASSQNMCDSYFWKLICEKLREVRDVMCIHDLLKCVSAVVKVNYYDRDLFRMLSREFVDDLDKLSTDEIAQLLYCYFKQNVYSCDLVNAIGFKVTQSLSNTTQSNELDDESGDKGLLDKMIGFKRGKRKSESSKDENGLNFSSIGKICKYLHHFKFSNSNYFTEMANFFIKNCDKMTLIPRLEIFTFLDPKLHDSTPQLAQKLTTCFINSDFSNDSQLLHENEFELGSFLSSQLFSSHDSIKTLHSLTSLSSSVKLISLSILRFVSNATLTSDHWHDSVNSILNTLHHYSLQLTESMYQEMGQKAAEGLKSPFISSLEHLCLDSLLYSIRALNSCWRLKSVCKIFSFTLNDDNVHSDFLKSFDQLNFNPVELNLIQSVSACLNKFGSRGMSVENLTCAFESFNALINSSSLDESMENQLQQSVNLITKEIILQLVDFDRENLYRIALTLSTCPNPLLQAYLDKYPKITRMKSKHHHIHTIHTL